MSYLDLALKAKKQVLISQSGERLSVTATPDSGYEKNEINEKTVALSQGAAWPPVSLSGERRFRQPHAKLFPFLGRKVRTPAGPGTLPQVFADRVTVLLDTELSRCSWFSPRQVEPISWQFPVRD
jgi:hypothetical protein